MLKRRKAMTILIFYSLNIEMILACLDAFGKQAVYLRPS